MTLSLNEMETLLKALSSLHLNDPQSPLIKNNTIAMQQYGKVSLRINIFNSEIHCLHGLEELVSNEIPPLYAKLHRLDT